MELESVLFEKLPQFLTELAAEDLAERLNGQEESGRRVDPSGTIGGKTAGGNDVVNVWMNLEGLSPRMVHAEESDVGSQVLGIACSFEQGTGAGAEAQIV